MAQHKMRIPQHAGRLPKRQAACSNNTKHRPCWRISISAVHPITSVLCEMPPFGAHCLHSAALCSISTARHWFRDGASVSGLRLQLLLSMPVRDFSGCFPLDGAISRGPSLAQTIKRRWARCHDDYDSYHQRSPPRVRLCTAASRLSYSDDRNTVFSSFTPFARHR
jgi:hypothetical protein